MRFELPPGVAHVRNHGQGSGASLSTQQGRKLCRAEGAGAYF